MLRIALLPWFVPRQHSLGKALMELINDHLAVKARMVPPNDNGYILLAAEVEWRGPFLPSRRTKRELLGRLKGRCEELATREDVEEATLFRAVLVAPGEGVQLTRERGVRRARYDVVVLVRTATVADAESLVSDPIYRGLSETVAEAAKYTHEVVARNAVRLGDVDHRPNHAFLFNYFYADDSETLLPVFEYTAGWFQAKTGLANSTLLRPLDTDAAYGIINHASWPSMRTFLPHLILRPSFRSFVLANFKANGIAAQPIIYRRVAEDPAALYRHRLWSA